MILTRRLVGRHGRTPSILDRTAIVLLATMAAILGAANTVRAACADGPDTAVAIQFADSVFVGRVVALSNLHRSATMEVLEIWKGPDLSGQVEVEGASSGSTVVGPDDRFYVLGSTYLVVPNGSGPPFFDDTCSGTMPYTALGGQIPAEYTDAVGAVTARIPAVAASESPASNPLSGVDGSVLFLSVGGAAVAALAFWLVRRRRKTRGVSPGAESARFVATENQPAREKDELETQLPRAPQESASPGRHQKRSSRRQAKQDRSRSNGVRDGVGGKRSRRFGRSGLSNLEAVRKKTRRIKARQRRGRS